MPNNEHRQFGLASIIRGSMTQEGETFAPTDTRRSVTAVFRPSQKTIDEGGDPRRVIPYYVVDGNYEFKFEAEHQLFFLPNLAESAQFRSFYGAVYAKLLESDAVSEVSNRGAALTDTMQYFYVVLQHAAESFDVEEVKRIIMSQWNALIIEKGSGAGFGWNLRIIGEASMAVITAWLYGGKSPDGFAAVPSPSQKQFVFVLERTPVTELEADVSTQYQATANSST